MSKILIVEGDLSIQDFDLILLDVMLPKIDVFGVCEVIRQNSDVPTIMLTALDDEDISFVKWAVFLSGMEKQSKASTSEHNRTAPILANIFRRKRQMKTV